ncbi:protein phosphatase 1D-like [Uloborus diversus]|uniref:protein phosphatase 1D-like n=1 Tax=Uloborus diversus TaxID=327109 RepID=UPI00240989B3|nr:protein phosphatase 1D-like [Uloborus diversus]XP_054723493.1 protein phosphatase 1D-like [Uloborus diversus]
MTHIGLNLRVTGHCNQGGRKYMEDAFVVAYQQTEDQKDLEYAYFGIFDGHGGREAALFAKEHLMNNIVCQKSFWSDDDNQVLKAIRDGFLATHQAMWREVGKWPKTVSGLPSTSGTTSSIAFIRRRKLYIGHVGDSKIVLGFQLPGQSEWCSYALTKDHKPESPEERQRINKVGGLVLNKAGVERVVWNRPRPGHKGPVRRSTPFDQIPFLAVARSLGDLWSYNYLRHEFVVSPDPDVDVININPRMHRCVIFASDGLWNMLTTQCAVRIVQTADEENEKIILENGKTNGAGRQLNNPSKILVDAALRHWYELGMRADNTSVVTVMLDPPGPPKSEVLLRQRVMKRLRPRDDQIEEECDASDASAFDVSSPSGSREKRKISEEQTPLKERKRSSELTEPPAKERRLSTDSDDSIPRNLPKPVVLSPKRVEVKYKVVFNHADQASPAPESNVPKAPEKPQTYSKLTSADVNQPNADVLDVRAKKKGHDPPHDEDIIKTSETNSCGKDINSVTSGCSLDNKSSVSMSSSDGGEPSTSKTTSNENCNDKSYFQSDTSTICPRKGDSDSLLGSENSKENDRVHLCEVDNIFKLTNRTTYCFDSSDNVKQSPQKDESTVEPKMKNFRKSTLRRRNDSLFQKTMDVKKRTHSLRASNYSSCKTDSRRDFGLKTRAHGGLRKLKV